MFHRKNAVFTAVAGLLACSGFAMADSTQIEAPSLTLNPKAITAQDAPQGLLMQGLDKVGAEKTLADQGINVYGWLETGWTWNHRWRDTADIQAQGNLVPGPFNHEWGNHVMINQFVIRVEKIVDASKGKFDVGGMIELMYGTDAARIHSTGLGYNGSDSTDNNDPNDPIAVANFHPIMQFDIPQAYLDIVVPVGNGLVLRVGKFVTLMGYETIDPRTNNFYSHSYMFQAIPFTQSGIYGTYVINDKWTVKAGISKGWDVTLEEQHPDPTDPASGSLCAIDAFGQVVYTHSDTLSLIVNWSTGPENANDTSHYRTVIDPIVVWKATKELTFAAEAIYVYDGGFNQEETGATHAYGDEWGLALYGTYLINDMFTLNGRLEKFHSYTDAGALGDLSENPGFASGGDQVPNVNVYGITLGVTITPFPKDPIGRNLIIRPEIKKYYK